MDRPASCAGANADLSCTWNHLDIAAEAVLALDGNRKMEDTAMSNLLPPPERCQTMAEVRAAIDTLDHDILTLLSERIRYIEAAARNKTTSHLRRADRKS